MMGNEAKVDELGFVTPEKHTDPASLHVFTRIPCMFQFVKINIEILKMGQIQGKNKLSLDISSNCWVCEGWSHMEFKIHRSHVLKLIKDDNFRQKYKEMYGVSCQLRVNLHLSFDGYKATMMEFSKHGWKDYYIIYRMVPSGTLTYFFSVGYLNAYDGVEKSKTKTLVDERLPVFANGSDVIQTDMIELQVQKLNYIDGDIELLCKTLTYDELDKMKAKPRPDRFMTPRPKKPWNKLASFFGPKPQRGVTTFKSNDELIAECFDFDWRCSKLEKWLEVVQKP